MYLLPRRPMPSNIQSNEIQAQAGYVPQPMPDIAPQPPRMARYLQPRPQPVALPSTPASVGLGEMPANKVDIPLNSPNLAEPASPVGRMPMLTDRRNSSGIEAPPSVTPQQSEDLDGLGNSAKYVRGVEEQPASYLGAGRPNLDPLSQARQETGTLKPLGLWGRLKEIGKGALLGAANSGGGDLSTVLGGAIGGSLLGGTDYLRKRQQEYETNKRASEIAQQQAYQRQAQEDELRRRQAETSIKNIETDNELNRERQAETKRNNEEKARIAQERNNINRTIANGRLDVSQTKTLNDIARNLKGTGVELPDDVADGLQLPRGTVLQDNPQNPSRYSVLRLRDGRILNYDKTTGQLADTGQQDTPIQNSAQVNAQAQLNALNGVQTNANGQVDNPAALRYLESLNMDPSAPDAEILLQQAKIPRYIDPTKTEQFKQNVIREKAKGSGVLGTRPNTQPAQQQPLKTGQRQHTPQDLQTYQQLKQTNPNARQAFMNKFGVDPDTL